MRFVFAVIDRAKPRAPDHRNHRLRPEVGGVFLNQANLFQIQAGESVQVFLAREDKDVIKAFLQLVEKRVGIRWNRTGLIIGTDGVFRIIVFSVNGIRDGSIGIDHLDKVRRDL